jgi:TonB family protein
LTDPEPKVIEGWQQERQARDGFALEIPSRRLRLTFDRNTLEKLRAGVLGRAGGRTEMEAVLFGREVPAAEAYSTLEIVEADLVEWGRELNRVPALQRERRLLESAVVPRSDLRCVGFVHIWVQGAPAVDPVHVRLVRDRLVGPDYMLLLLWAAGLDSIAGAVFVQSGDGLPMSAEPAVYFESGPAGTRVLAPEERGTGRPGNRKFSSERGRPDPVFIPDSRPTPRIPWQWLALLLFLAVVAAEVVIYQMHRPVAAVSTPAAVDALTIDRDGAEIRLQWNRQAPIFTGAEKAELIIRDGIRTKVVGLDLMVERGLVLYTMSGEEAEFQILVHGQRERMESVRVIRTRDQHDIALEKTLSEPLLPANRAPRTSPALEPISREEPQSPAGQPKSEKQFHLAPAAPAAQGPVQLPSVPDVALPSLPAMADVRAAIPPPPVIESGPVEAAPKPALPLVVDPARAVQRVLPKIPAQMRWFASRATVSVTVGVDESGQVVSARISEADEQGKTMENLVLAAARQWQFQPARINGKPVHSETVIQFNLRPAGPTAR